MLRKYEKSQSIKMVKVLMREIPTKLMFWHCFCFGLCSGFGGYFHDQNNCHREKSRKRCKNLEVFWIFPDFSLSF
jgi:sulfite exporter TauE/SafE